MSDLIPAWAWALLETYVEKRLELRGKTNPIPRETLEEFARLWPDLSCTLMVQEPWMGTIRFKKLLRLRGDAMRPFLEAPETFLRERFGGGKYKMNFHHGMNFVNTRNFRAQGPPLWQSEPGLSEVEDE